MATGWSPTEMAGYVFSPAMSTGITTSPSGLTVYNSEPSGVTVQVLAPEPVLIDEMTSSIGVRLGTSTVKLTAFDVAAPLFTVTGPGMAPAGTLTTSSVLLPLIGVALVPLNDTVFDAGF